jgi:hypothetical protein
MRVPKIRARRSAAPVARASDERAPLFETFELVDVLHPSRKERAALRDLLEHPPDIAAVALQARADVAKRATDHPA